MKPNNQNSASAGMSAYAAIFTSTLLWGTWWIPLRILNDSGIGHVWANAAGLLLPLLVLLPLAIRHRSRLYSAGRALWLSGFFIAAAISLYAEALLRGYVARVLLLFYLTTAWSTLLGYFMLQQPIDRQRLLSIGLALCGAFVIFGADGGWPLPTRPAEWMGLLSGLSWALGTTLLHRANRYALSDKIIVQFLFIGPLFTLFALLPGGRGGLLVAPADVTGTVLWLLALAFIWTLPLIALTLYAASRIDPGKIAILLTFEVVVGVCSAWWLAGEPFGFHEAGGALLILAAVGAEVCTRINR